MLVKTAVFAVHHAYFDLVVSAETDKQLEEACMHIAASFGATFLYLRE